MFIENPSYASNWVITPKRDKGGIIVGQYPMIDYYPSQHIDKLIKNRVSVWVNLVEQKEKDLNGDYKNYVKENTNWCSPKFISFPIPDGMISRDKEFFDLIEKVYSLFCKRHIIYVHCHAGHGRAGLFATCFLMRHYKWEAGKALDVNQLLYLSRKRNFKRPSPGSLWQINQIRRYCPPKTIIITGDRESANSFQKIIYRVLKDLPKGSVIIHGACKGVDTISGKIASELGFKVIEYPIKGSMLLEYGRAAGTIRNRKMLEEKPDAVFAFHPDIIHSKGTKDMIMAAHLQNFPVYIYDLKDIVKFEGDFYSM